MLIGSKKKSENRIRLGKKYAIIIVLLCFVILENWFCLIIMLRFSASIYKIKKKKDGWLYKNYSTN